VNAADINEMPANVLYVEGSQLDRFLQGRVGLLEARRPNGILVVVNAPVTNKTINAVSAARATIGIDAEIVELDTPLEMTSFINQDGTAGGGVKGVQEMFVQLSGCRHFDALAIHTPVTVDRDVQLKYFKEGGLNPWGGVEALASRMIADKFNVPIAHAPLDITDSTDEELFFVNDNQAVDPRIAAEVSAVGCLHSVLKGLHLAPQTTAALKEWPEVMTNREIDFMVTPYNCWGRPHVACTDANIPVIAVRENETVLDVEPPFHGVISVNSYWEAAGLVMTIKAGINPFSVRWPLDPTSVIEIAPAEPVDKISRTKDKHVHFRDYLSKCDIALHNATYDLKPEFRDTYTGNIDKVDCPVCKAWWTSENE